MLAGTTAKSTHRTLLKFGSEVPEWARTGLWQLQPLFAAASEPNAAESGHTGHPVPRWSSISALSSTAQTLAPDCHIFCPGAHFP